MARALAASPSLAARRARLDAARIVVQTANVPADPMVEFEYRDANFPKWTIGTDPMSMTGASIRQPLLTKARKAARRAAAKADELLATSDEQWERLKPLMAENDPNFNDATFKALKRRYQEGIPERSVAENETDAKVLYQFLRELGGEKLVGPATELAPGTFWHDGKP